MTHKWGLERMDVGDTCTVEPGDGVYSRQFHIRVSSSAQNFAKRLLKANVPVSFRCRRSRPPDEPENAVIIERIPYRPSRRNKKRKSPSDGRAAQSTGTARPGFGSGAYSTTGVDQFASTGGRDPDSAGETTPTGTGSGA